MMKLFNSVNFKQSPPPYFYNDNLFALKKRLFAPSFLLIICFLLFTGCQPDRLKFSTNKKGESHNKKTFSDKRMENDNYFLKKEFALALHQAMIQNEDLREFIKEEALKKFDGDYDVLYNYVKDKTVGGSTFRQLLLPYFENEAALVEIEQKIGALTIFIPSLPNNSFSAETWNTSTEIPLIAIRLLSNEKTPIINSKGQSYLLDENAIPGFPVVVIKECERITVPGFSGYYSNANREYISTSGFKFKFSSKVFNNLDPTVSMIGDLTPNYLVEAWEVNGKHQNIGWQRDYLYYTLSQNNSIGPYISNYSEFIKNFGLEGDPMSALNYIAQPPLVSSNLSDPLLEPVNLTVNGEAASFWTDGDFEFNVNILYDVDESPLEKGFFAYPSELFDINYGQDNQFFMTLYYITDLGKKMKPLNLEILPWRLHNYSNEWRIDFEEQDLNVVVTKTKSNKSTYNTNFTFDAEIKKVGLEFGGSAQTTKSKSVSWKYTKSSNDLKEAVINFGENIIIDEESYLSSSGFPLWIEIEYKYYRYKRYTTGRCSFSLVPIKVQ